MDHDQCNAASDAKVRLYTFHAIVALLEGGNLPGGSRSASTTAQKVIKLCKDEQQRQLREWDRLSERAAKVNTNTRIVLRPTHWADDRGYVVTDEWLQSPKATSDYRAAYNIPGRMVRGKFKPLDPAIPVLSQEGKQP